MLVGLSGFTATDEMTGMPLTLCIGFLEMYVGWGMYCTRILVDDSLTLAFCPEIPG